MSRYHSPRLLVFWMVVIGIFLLHAGSTLYSKSGNPKRQYAESDILIKFRPSASASDRTNARVEVNGRVLRTFNSGAEHWRLGPGQTVEHALERMKKNPRVEYAEPNYVIVPTVGANDTLIGDQWALADIDADGAWDRTRGCGIGTPGCSRAVRVAVTDTGIAKHEDLEANVNRSLSYDFADNDSDADPGCIIFQLSGHGTHVAGIIGAVGNNSKGIAGVNWSVSLMALKIYPNSELEGLVADAAAAINYATDHDADIINASWEINEACELPCAQTLYDAIAEAGTQGIVFVAAAGNHGENNDIPGEARFPAAYDLPNVIAVAATDSADEFSDGFSAYGATTVALGAPGISVLSTVLAPWTRCDLPIEPETCPHPTCTIPESGDVYTRGPSTYVTNSGTSMAAPHVAGVAALLRALDPTISVSRIKDILLSSVDKLPSLQGKTISGGRLNAHCAVETLLLDSDGDLRGDACDNCPAIYNPDQSDPTIGNPVVTVQSPNGGNLLFINTPKVLKWSALDECGVSSVDLLLSLNGPGGVFQNIALNVPNTGSYNWNVTGPATSNAFLKVVARDPFGNLGSDLSNFAFNISGGCGPCQTSYCSDQGVRCIWSSSCGPGACCNYTCNSDPSCQGPDPCPQNACTCL